MGRVFARVPVHHIELVGADFSDQPHGHCGIKLPVVSVAGSTPAGFSAVLGMHFHQIANRSAAVEAARQRVDRVRAALHPGLKHLARFSSRQRDRAAVLDARGQGAFTVDM